MEALTDSVGADGTPAPEINVGTPPADWKAKPPSPMRLASFEADGNNGAVADISLVLLSGPAGGILDNVNRWQSQLGQPEFTEESLARKVEHLSLPLGELTLVDLQGLPAGADAAKDGRIIGAMVAHEGATFFFKMRGNTELVGAQKDAFVKWVGTVRGAAVGATASPSPR